MWGRQIAPLMESGSLDRDSESVIVLNGAKVGIQTVGNQTAWYLITPNQLCTASV